MSESAPLRPATGVRQTLGRRSRFKGFCYGPDGQWLVTGGRSDYRAWKVGSWEPGFVIAREDTAFYAGPLAFSRDGRLLAITGSQQQVQLFDFAKQRALATLSAPDARRLSRLCFNHDGTELAASADNHVVQLWDLRALRRQLQEMNLDWDREPYPPARPAERNPVPMPVEVRLGAKPQ